MLKQDDNNLTGMSFCCQRHILLQKSAVAVTLYSSNSVNSLEVWEEEGHYALV
jgi:hypothetical protein